jgi:hypothetical protein
MTMAGKPKEIMTWATEAEQSVKTITDRLRAMSAAFEAEIDVALNSLEDTLKAGESAVESLELLEPEMLGYGLGEKAAEGLRHVHPSAELPIAQAKRERLSVVLHQLEYVLPLARSGRLTGFVTPPAAPTAD